jgi:hypothetical protein
MKCWNLLAVGACLADPAAAAEGQAALAAWWGYTQTNGITEYLSPTYYGTDLDSLALIARHAPDGASRAIARSALALLWPTSRPTGSSPASGWAARMGATTTT